VEGSRQWQAQPPPQQLPPVDIVDGVKPPAVLKPNTDSLRITFGLAHAGHATAIVGPETYVSNSLSQWVQRYS
jgi:hypothetical protein